MLSDYPVIKIENVSKSYMTHPNPLRRLYAMFDRSVAEGYEFFALKQAHFELQKGEVLGLIGRNGAGKSTLLQLICGTLTPTTGRIIVRGRVAALLELGAGFNPEFSGRENIFLYGTVLGLTYRELLTRYDQIVEFAGIGTFVEQPVKTYSSGMYMRLAFSIATHIDPDILIIDEALSVGDGAFGRKSFKRIMDLKDRGCSIIFCSHSLYQVDALCHRAIWLEAGVVQMCDKPGEVISAYEEYLLQSEAPQTISANTKTTLGHARILATRIFCDNQTTYLELESGVSELRIEIDVRSDLAIPAPHAAVSIHLKDGTTVTSTSSHLSGLVSARDDKGISKLAVIFSPCQLLQGRYLISIHLFCENGIHVYESADAVATINVRQKSAERGVARLPHRWVDIT